MNIWLCTSDSRTHMDLAYQKGGLWGARSGKMLDKWWREISKGDLALFYLGQPISGLVGAGKIERKPSRDEIEPVWPDETPNRIIYPNRFSFKILHPKSNRPVWESHKIPIYHEIDGIRGLLGYGFKPVRDKHIQSKLINRVRDSDWV